MTQFKAQTTNTNNIWDSKKRYKVNSVVTHSGIEYLNVTGGNSLPTLAIDWLVCRQPTGPTYTQSETDTLLLAKLSNDPTTYTPATLPLSGTEIVTLNNGVNWVKITWNNIKAQLSLLYAPKDETIITNLSVSGTYNIDYSAGNVWRLTFVGPTTLTESNVPTTGKTKTITINGNGNFPITYPAGFTGFITGSYTGTATLNTITVQTLGTDRKVQIVQPT